jgi:hypothetical protein
MSVIHMDTETVKNQGRRLMYAASDMLDKSDELRISARSLRQRWTGPTAETFCNGFDRLVISLRAKALELDALAKSVMNEVDEWVEVDRTESAYLTELKKEFSLSPGNIKGWIGKSINIYSAINLAKNLRLSSLRPNSVVFTGPNWLRKALGIKEATRVIKPGTLAKNMAILGLAVSATDGIGAAVEDLTDARYEDTSRAVSAAVVDGAFRFTLSAVGTVALPLALGAIVAGVGLAAAPAAAIVLVGSIVGGIAYSTFAETPLWELWKQSATRDQVIENFHRAGQSLDNFLTGLSRQAAEGVTNAFGSFVQSVSKSSVPVLAQG